jgi:glycosyltransferase involved in cell wall biosynthesis
MAAKCPVLVSNIGPMPEVCGDACLYCAPLRIDDIAYQMRRLLCDDALRVELRKRGRVQANKYRWDDCIEKTGDVIEMLLGK